MRVFAVFNSIICGQMDRPLEANKRKDSRMIGWMEFQSMEGGTGSLGDRPSCALWDCVSFTAAACKSARKRVTSSKIVSVTL